MLRIEFDGFFQCRLATDPDPWDEPRGISGWTFALAGEPDLDRIVRFQDPLVVRSHGPPIGVEVRRVSLHGEAVPDHPLVGGRVELLDNPKFEGRNGLVAEDGQEPILPFHLAISGSGMRLRRADPLDSRGRPIHEVDRSLIFRQISEPDSPPSRSEILEAVGVDGLKRHREEREQLLRRDLERTHDDTERVAVDKRLDELGEIRPWVLPYGFSLGALGGAGEIEGGNEQLGVFPPWPIRFWLGGWDADTLCGFARGRLEIPAYVSHPTP